MTLLSSVLGGMVFSSFTSKEHVLIFVRRANDIVNLLFFIIVGGLVLASAWRREVSACL